MQRLLPRLRASPVQLAVPSRHVQTRLPLSTKSSATESESEPATSKSTGGGPDMPDSLSEGDAKGRTGGGKPLQSSKNAPPQPKIFNASISVDGEKNLTEEQKKEVEEHNRAFEEKHDRAAPAQGDKVDQKFWGDRGQS